MNICGTMAANLCGGSIKRGGKSFYGELKEDGTFYVLAVAECLPNAAAFHGVLSLPVFSNPLMHTKSSSVQRKLLIFCFPAPPLDVTLIFMPVMEILHDI